MSAPRDRDPVFVPAEERQFLDLVDAVAPALQDLLMTALKAPTDGSPAHVVREAMLAYMVAAGVQDPALDIGRWMRMRIRPQAAAGGKP